MVDLGTWAPSENLIVAPAESPTGPTVDLVVLQGNLQGKWYNGWDNWCCFFMYTT